MKRLKKIILTAVFVFVFLMAAALPALGVEVTEELEDALNTDIVENAVPESAREIIGRAEIETGEGQKRLFEDIWNYIKENSGKQLKQAVKSAASVLLIAVLTSLVTSAFDVKQSYTVMAGVAGISAVTVSSAASFISLGRDTLSEISTFSKVLLPTLATAGTVSGAYTSSGAKYAVSVFFIDLLISAAEKLIIPLICAYLAAGIAAAALGGDGIGAVVSFLKWLTVTIMTSLVMIFTAFLSITGIVSGSADATVQRMTKTAISTALPVVGGIVSDAAGAVAAGAALLKNGIGVFGMIVVLAVCTVPFLKIGFGYLTYKAAAGLCGTVADSRITKLLGTIGTAFGMILGIVGASALMLFVSVIISMKAVT
ncbi:MAG: hypothetical protein IJ017_09135 [Oscillospiraceae bacterium]|nr:hypothetical protein [Oscillospiraceae bacterium]